MIQSGVNKLTLYNAADTTYTRVSATEVADISGTSIEIPNENKPTFQAPVLKINRKLKFDHSFTFTLFDLDNSILSQLDNKFGWLVLIDFYNGDTYFSTTPSFKIGTELNVNNTHVYPVTLKPNLPTIRTMEVVETPPAVFVGVRNGGYSDTTDWINPTSGIAEYWQGGDVYDTHSIITGSGFTGNAQKMELITTSAMAGGIIRSSEVVALSGVNITLNLKYILTAGTDVFIRNLSDGQLLGSLFGEQLTAVEKNIDITLTDPNLQLTFDLVGTKTAGMFYAIDEIKYKVNS